MKVKKLGALTLFSVWTTVIAACSYAGNGTAASAKTWGKTAFNGLKWQSEGSKIFLKPYTIWRTWRKLFSYLPSMT